MVICCFPALLIPGLAGQVMNPGRAGGSGRTLFADMAEKWGVSKARISQDKARIMEMVRKRAEEPDRER